MTMTDQSMSRSATLNKVRLKPSHELQPNNLVDSLPLPIVLPQLREHDESLNPQSPKFDLEKWLRVAMNDLARDRARDQNMGIVFKNLNVYGSGAALQFQETVSTLLMAPLRLPQVIRESHSPRRRILKDFKGLLKKSELLLVLGRPGASTFLKALCGELHGLDLDKESVIHYNGKFE